MIEVSVRENDGSGSRVGAIPTRRNPSNLKTTKPGQTCVHKYPSVVCHSRRDIDEIRVHEDDRNPNDTG